VDSNDRERVNEAKDELSRMLAEDELKDAVLLVFANKQVHKIIGGLVFMSCGLVGFAQCHECSRNHRQAWFTFTAFA